MVELLITLHSSLITAFMPISRILLVEDHEALAVLRCALLRLQGYEIVLAADGREACRLLEQEPFDLVVTDVELPEGSGWDVATAAKKHQLPVILSTGWPLRALNLPEVDFVIAKPSSVAEFLSLVHSALKKPRSKSHAKQSEPHT